MLGIDADTKREENVCKRSKEFIEENLPGSYAFAVKVAPAAVDPEVKDGSLIVEINEKPKINRTYSIDRSRP